ncbi:hypothetical protein SAMN05444172_5268 [Burkholderia sp. GAS332]|nr:hypothetical protein SAMN05444172_5268 [Burkholderia sp. GAS332]
MVFFGLRGAWLYAYGVGLSLIFFGFAALFGCLPTALAFP